MSRPWDRSVFCPDLKLVALLARPRGQSPRFSVRECGPTVAIKPEMGVHAASRLQTFSYVGVQDCPITCCTLERYCWFREATIVVSVCEPLLQFAREEQFGISAYCFMPDHVHIFAEGTSPTSSIRKLIQRWKQKTGYAHRRALGGRLWQGGYYDHVLREDEDRHAAIRYLLTNPVRAGLVSDVRDYPLWGSSVRDRESC